MGNFHPSGVKTEQTEGDEKMPLQALNFDGEEAPQRHQVSKSIFIKPVALFNRAKLAALCSQKGTRTMSHQRNPDSFRRGTVGTEAVDR